MESLPPAIDQGLDNVAIIIQDWPTREQMEDNDIQDRRGLLGLYEGVPLVDRPVMAWWRRTRSPYSRNP